MQLFVIRNEKEGLEKLVNKNKTLRFFMHLLKNFSFIVFFILSFNTYSQEKSFVKGNEYVLEDIKVSGLKSFNEQTVITYTGLRKGDKVRIPRNIQVFEEGKKFSIDSKSK